MQICVHDHVEFHPQKKKEVLYFVKKKNLGETGESSDQLSESESDSAVVIYVYGITRNRLEIYILGFHNTDSP